MNISPRENPFAYDVKKKKTRTVTRPYNHINDLLNQFYHSNHSCVSIDSSDYYGPSQCLYSVASAIKRHGYEDSLETHMYKGEILLLKSAAVDHSKIKRGRACKSYI